MTVPQRSEPRWQINTHKWRVSVSAKDRSLRHHLRVCCTLQACVVQTVQKEEKQKTYNRARICTKPAQLAHTQRQQEYSVTSEEAVAVEETLVA